jgi:hypothetical protein
MTGLNDRGLDASGLSRRRLLQLAGAAGLTTLTGAMAAPVSLASPPPTSASELLLCRDAWGARPPRPGGRPHTITRMTIHHTAVVLGDNSNITSRLRQHQRYHQDDKGWVDIAYHAGVDRDGNIFELRRTEIAGDTATNYDTTGHFLVVCEGNFDEEPISEAQLNGAALAFAWAAQEFGITSSTLASHQQVASATSCPGANLQAHIASGDLKRRIDDLVTAGAVELQPVCGPQAAEAVAAIESGR